MKALLVASKNTVVYEPINACFGSEYKIDIATSYKSCLNLFRKKRYEFLFIDIELLQPESPPAGERVSYKDSFQPFWHMFPNAEIIVMSSQEKIREAVMAVKAGASNYITYPVDKDELKFVTESIYESTIMQSELDYLRDKFWQIDSIEVVSTESPEMRKVFERIRSVSPTKTTVLLTGETGTGKGLLAKLIHRHSNRGRDQFITVHCGAIPDTLLESELFGHEKGAFTGADRRKLGKFEIAQGGTLFLDEIGTMTPSAQIKFLEVLQDRTFQRVGGEANIKSDVRIIAATNINLKQLVANGTFRKDLYYRLNVFPVDIPPLRERTEDIPQLAGVFLRNLNETYSKEINSIHPYVLEAFARYSWPGNIRELENLMERAYILENSSVLGPESFPSELFLSDFSHPTRSSTSLPSLSDARRKNIEVAERNYLKRLLAVHKGHIRKSADTAGISTRQLHKLLTRYGIKKEDFKLSSS